MIPIYIGYDRKETVAYHVLSHSILTRAQQPVAIAPINRENIKPHFWRKRGEYDSTDFSNSRFIVPHLQDFEGFAIFMDCDMLCRTDISRLWEQRHRMREEGKAVLVKKHDHQPTEEEKFLGAKQTKYKRKNWSSLILFDCNRCRQLTRHIVNTITPGLWLHQFDWLADEEIGEIEGNWNLLIDYDEYDPESPLVHFTKGGPWHGYNDVDYVKEWWWEYDDMVNGDNPVAWNVPGRRPREKKI